MDDRNTGIVHSSPSRALTHNRMNQEWDIGMEREKRENKMKGNASREMIKVDDGIICHIFVKMHGDYKG